MVCTYVTEDPGSILYEIQVEVLRPTSSDSALISRDNGLGAYLDLRRR